MFILKLLNISSGWKNTDIKRLALKHPCPSLGVRGAVECLDLVQCILSLFLCVSSLAGRSGNGV